jgi:hypothetical protein
MNLFTLAMCIAEANDQQPQGTITVTGVTITVAELQVRVWMSRFTHYRLFERMMHARFPEAVILDNHEHDALGSHYVVCAPHAIRPQRGTDSGECPSESNKIYDQQ